MSFNNDLNIIIEEISNAIKKIDQNQISILVNKIKESKRVFVSGKGRSGLMIASFANRLMHLGFDVHIVGDLTTPHTDPQDLLILSSGSGETSSIIELAKIANKNKVFVALITTNNNSTVAKQSQIIVNLPGPSKKTERNNSVSTIQPMGSLFEQLSLLVYDSIILQLMRDLGETSDTMLLRHANLE
ncbi:6-phospho-3-hexuloisomerase [Heyndrickxia acidiproducens]|uniref:6-phospho-3-hexuloisomerase n=1 Tax=Heyndrickxia acidiproducens TaxID=1121084 RepID=UPI0003636B4F|nr:6-phospho-3-hexuloisomerase [Heyndrickxia acidiproducens]